MKRLLIFALATLLVSLLAAAVFAEDECQLPLPKDSDDALRDLNWRTVNGDDAYGGTERNGEDYVEEGEFHGGNGYKTPVGDDDEEDDEEEGLNIPPIILGMIGVQFVTL